MTKLTTDVWFDKLRQARAELAQAQVDKELAQQGHLIASQEVVDLRAELAQTQIECNVLATTLTDANELHATVRDELAQAQRRLAIPDQICGYCGYRYSAGTNEANFAVMAEHIKSCPKHPLSKALAELTLRTRNRNFWFQTCLDAEGKRDEMRQAAQEQSDEVQRDWLSPAEAEGLRRQLAQAVVAQADAELAAHVHDKACGELAQTAHTERAQRQVAETSERASRKMLARQCDMARDAEAKAMEAKRCHKAALALAQNRATRLEKAEQRAERAEALAALVTMRAARLLERLARHAQMNADDHGNSLSTAVNLWRNDAEAARELAAQIREALALEGDDAKR